MRRSLLGASGNGVASQCRSLKCWHLTRCVTCAPSRRAASLRRAAASHRHRAGAAGLEATATRRLCTVRLPAGSAGLVDIRHALLASRHKWWPAGSGRARGCCSRRALGATTSGRAPAYSTALHTGHAVAVGGERAWRGSACPPMDRTRPSCRPALATDDLALAQPSRGGAQRGCRSSRRSSQRRRWWLPWCGSEGAPCVFGSRRTPTQPPAWRSQMGNSGGQQLFMSEQHVAPLASQQKKCVAASLLLQHVWSSSQYRSSPQYTACALPRSAMRASPRSTRSAILRLMHEPAPRRSARGAGAMGPPCVRTPSPSNRPGTLQLTSRAPDRLGPQPRTGVRS